MQTITGISARRKWQYVVNLSCPHFEQEAQPSQTDRAMLRVTEYFAKSLKVIAYSTI